MVSRKSRFSDIFRRPVNLVVFASVFALLSMANLAYAQSSVSVEAESDLLELLVSELIAALAGFLGLGVSALIGWLRNRGIPVSSEQEATFRTIVTKRFQQLAKDSWTEMRDHPERLDEYWSELRNGKVPGKFVERLRKEGFEFAMELKDNREFKDFARDITELGMKRLLKDLRTELKLEYQQRMLDVIPRLASTAVDSAFNPNVTDVKIWSARALENMKPLLLSTEAIDKEENLMIVIKAEINKRLQKVYS